MLSEVRVSLADLSEGTRKLLWRDDSEPMVLFSQWLGRLGNTKRVRFLFYVYRGREPGGLGLQTIYDVPLASP